MLNQIAHLFFLKVGIVLKSNKIKILSKWLLKKNKNSIYFGNIKHMSGGPKSRTSRMIKRFGNQIFMPNIIYAQSCWQERMLSLVTNNANLDCYKIIFNQNGWYYPGWYKGDWRKNNSIIINAQKKSHIVIYQSRFCYEAGKLLNNYEPPVSRIIYNGIKIEDYKYLEKRGDGRTIWLSGIFTQDSCHILRPALDALLILSTKYKKNDCPRLLISGKFTRKAKRSKWWQKIQEDIIKLQEKKIIHWLGEYSSNNYEFIAKKVDIALHLKYKDPCPNAVLERMASGIPHVYSHSGGTPELIGHAGIGLNVNDSWDKQVPVNSKELAFAIEQALINKANLSFLSRTRALEFGWNEYINEHEKIFNEI